MVAFTTIVANMVCLNNNNKFSCSSPKVSQRKGSETSIRRDRGQGYYHSRSRKKKVGKSKISYLASGFYVGIYARVRRNIVTREAGLWNAVVERKILPRFPRYFAKVLLVLLFRLTQRNLLDWGWGSLVTVISVIVLRLVCKNSRSNYRENNG